jgi:hypothetical protein
LIVPVTALPPFAPFTNQFTEIFAEPVTVALNCCEAPNRTLARFGETDTVTPEDGGLVPPDLEEFAVRTPQPNWTEVQARSNARVKRGTIDLRV